MAGIVLLRDGSDWQASSSVFYWAVDELAERVSSSDLAQTLRDISAFNLGSLAMRDLPPDQRSDLVATLRELPGVAADTLPQTDQRRAIVALVQELADLVAASERD